MSTPTHCPYCALQCAQTLRVVPDAVPPNIGYLAQSFQVADLDATARACAAVGAEAFSGPIDIDLPGRGPCKAMVVRNPGSGALQELFQVS